MAHGWNLLSYGTSRSTNMLGSDVGTRGKKVFPLEKNYSGSGRKKVPAGHFGPKIQACIARNNQ